MDKQLIEKVKNANSPEELLTLAKANNMELSLSEANNIYKQFHQSGELSDDELDSVAGGACATVENGEEYAIVFAVTPCFLEPKMYAKNPSAKCGLFTKGERCGTCIHYKRKSYKETYYCDCSQDYMKMNK